jgi:peptidoglycan hydrolase-like protein with peptidoglycan-binding domain
MFEILTADQLIKRLKGRKYKYTQIHHTWNPNHSDFNGKNHIELQQGMKNYHVNTRGWDDIGQHVTLMPDGLFVTGRAFNKTPAGISGYNTGAFMTEMLGDFDKGKDKLQGAQLDAVLKVQHFLITECGAQIMFHREHASKTCPGTGIDQGEFIKQVVNYNQSVKAAELPKQPTTQSPPVTNSVVPYPGHLIKRGSKGKNVERVQRAVGVTADGIFGPNTERAVKAYQSRHGLVADGLVGPKSWSVLF